MKLLRAPSLILILHSTKMITQRLSKEESVSLEEMKAICDNMSLVYPSYLKQIFKRANHE